MRLNKYIASATGMSRRAADKAIEWGRVTINGTMANTGQQVAENDVVALDGTTLKVQNSKQTIMLNKPVGYICSRDGQGGKTIYDLLPENLHHIKPVGRLDKNSSGLLLLTDDGDLAHSLTHPSFRKTKIYKIALNKPLEPLHRQMIGDNGIMLDDGVSKLQLERINDTDNSNWKVLMHEGRNRQIRRTFEALGYNVVKLHRTNFGSYALNNLKVGEHRVI
jgi:23S rRNA pseudouridine2605 synthase